MIAITWRINPDLDAVACAIAYEYYFKQQWITDRAAIFQWNPHPEAVFIAKELWAYVHIRDGKEIFDQIIFVDFSEMIWAPDFVKSWTDVIEMIDHRSFPNYESCPNAKFQIELVWSATTLISEKFQFADVQISPEIANLLYCGTLSNTLNFKANITTLRDHRSAEWLISQWASTELGKKMFDYKTQYIQDNLEEVLLEDSKITKLPNGETMKMMQLELLDGGFLYTTGNITKNLRERGFLDVDHATIFVQDLLLWKTKIFIEEWLKNLFLIKWFEGALIDKFRWEMPKLYLRKELIPMINKLCI